MNRWGNRGRRRRPAGQGRRGSSVVDTTCAMFLVALSVNLRSQERGGVRGTSLLGTETEEKGLRPSFRKSRPGRTGVRVLG